MKEISILGENRFETFTRTRTACRAIIVRNGMILLSHEIRSGWWLIPGGGMEEGETPEECCIREVEEETGLIARPFRQFLTMYEYYEEYRYVSHYFICDVTGRGRMRLTDEEARRGAEPKWLPLREALGIFSQHRSCGDISEEKRGSYQREYTALQEYLKAGAATRRMTAEEYECFKAYSVSGYAEDLIRGEGLDRDRALKKAEEEFRGMLPGGPDTEGQFLRTVEDAETGREVGWIWFSFEEAEGIRQVFLSDLLIREDERGKGCASAALQEMEQAAKARGCTESVLYVWEHNRPGYSLYRKCGYEAARRGEGGTYMKKKL